MPTSVEDVSSAPDAVTRAVTNRVSIIQLWLCDLAATFPVVRMTSDGAFMVACPADARHACLVWMTDDGTPAVGCPTCRTSRELFERFLDAFCARLPEWECWIRPMPPGPVPETGWKRQPAGAPAIALRTMCDGSVQGITQPGRESEVLEWIRQ